MIDISKGRYWDLPWSLVDGCTPCSPGCDHCWSAGMAGRFHSGTAESDGDRVMLVTGGKFTGEIITHPERLTIPLKRQKPTVYAVWNDWAHEALDHVFRRRMVRVAEDCPQHTILALTKRPSVALDFFQFMTRVEPAGFRFPDNWWTGITICNQPEADINIPKILQVPGKKFLSIEPMLGAINLRPWMGNVGKILDPDGDPESSPGGRYDSFLRRWVGDDQPEFDAVILGGETGSGARPMHPDWVRSVRDQCAAAGVPFFFKGWGEWAPSQLQMVEGCVNHTNGHYWYEFDPSCKGKMKKLGRKCGRLLDGRTHDDLPWVTK